MLLDHQVNRFLSIVKVEFVIFSLSLLFWLLPIILNFQFHLSTSLLIMRERGSLWSFRFGKAALGARKNLLLELQLLAKLLSPVGSLMSIVQYAAASLAHWAAAVFCWNRLCRQIVQQHERWINLCLFVESLVKESDSFVVLFFKLAFDALILDELELFLFFVGRLLHLQLWHLWIFCHHRCLLNWSVCHRTTKFFLRF